MNLKHIWRIERERRKLIRDKSNRHGKNPIGTFTPVGPEVIGAFAKKSTTSFWKCLILYGFALRADKVLELGTGFGLSTSYLAAGCMNFVLSVDADSTCRELAWKLLKNTGLTWNAICEINKFDKTLDWCNREKLNKFDLAYIDGDHTGPALIRYFKKLIPLMSPNGVIIVDDVLWSEDMHRGYLECCTDKNVKRHWKIHDLGVIWLK